MKRAIRKALRLLSGAQTQRTCPICRWSGGKFTWGGPPNKRRFDARCPKCGSLERHRLAYYVASHCVSLDYSRVLHVAPEKELSKWLRSQSADYLSIDLYAPAMAKMDITRLELDDSSQSLIWMSHVLEHIVDDRKAISEIHRVLRPGGKAFIQVPVWRLETHEDFSKTTPEERNREFYQPDHVRLYGLDIVKRFEASGFTSSVFRAQQFGPDILLRHGLSFASTNEVFLFGK